MFYERLGSSLRDRLPWALTHPPTNHPHTSLKYFHSIHYCITNKAFTKYKTNFKETFHSPEDSEPMTHASDVLPLEEGETMNDST
jgi:hypothetical protein